MAVDMALTMQLRAEVTRHSPALSSYLGDCPGDTEDVHLWQCFCQSEEALKHPNGRPRKVPLVAFSMF